MGSAHGGKQDASTTMPTPGNHGPALEGLGASFGPTGGYTLKEGYEDALLFNKVPPAYYDPDFADETPPGAKIVIRLPIELVPKNVRGLDLANTFPNGHLYNSSLRVGMRRQSSETHRC